MATIEYSVHYNIRHILDQCSVCKVRLHIYTIDGDIQKDTQIQCHNKEYGQLRNENLYSSLLPRQKPYRFTTCILDKTDDETVHCNGKTIIQDYKVWNYAFSFGFDCDHSERPSLKGLSFNISIFDQANQTKCSPMPGDIKQLPCGKFYDHVSLRNLTGDSDLTSLDKWIDIEKHTMYELLIASIFPAESKGLCYQHTYKVMC